MKIDLVTLLWFLKIVMITFLGNFATILWKILDVIRAYSIYKVFYAEYFIILYGVLLLSLVGIVFLFYKINNTAIKARLTKSNSFNKEG